MNNEGENWSKIGEEVIGFWPWTNWFLLFEPQTSVQNFIKIWRAVSIGVTRDASDLIICPTLWYSNATDNQWTSCEDITQWKWTDCFFTDRNYQQWAAHHLLRCSTYKCSGVKQMIEVSVDQTEVRVIANSLDEVVFLSVFFDDRSSSVWVTTNSLMTVLHHTDRHRHTHRHTHTDTQTDRQTDRTATWKSYSTQTDTQTYTDRHIDRQTDRRTASWQSY